MKLSIVIPTYNGERFLDKLISILINQGLPQNEYEILFVDDCSTDDTRERLKELSESFSTVRYIFNAENRKLATTCNVGLKNAKGDYVWFIDQDDEVENGAGRELIDIGLKGELDVLLFNYSKIDEDNNILESPKVFQSSELMNGRNFLHKYFEHNIVTYLMGYRWRALYKRQYLIDNKILFPDGMMHDDTTFLFRAIYFSKRVKSVDNNFYRYRVNMSSYTHTIKASVLREFHLLIPVEELQVANIIRIEDNVFVDQIKNDAQKRLDSYINQLALLQMREWKSGLQYLRDITTGISKRTDVKTELCKMPIIGDIFFILYALIYRIYKKAKYAAQRNF